MTDIQSAVQLDISDSLRLYRTPISLSQSVVSRSSCRFATTGSSSFSPSNNRSITIRMSSMEYLDPTSCFLVFSFKPSRPGVIYQDNIMSIFDTARLTCGGRVLESLNNVSELMPTVFYGSTPASAINSALGELMGCDKYRTDKYAYVQAGNGTGATGQDASLAPLKLGSVSTVPGFDTGTSNVVMGTSGVSGDSIIQNSSNLINAYGHTSCSGLTKKYYCAEADQQNVDSGFVSGLHNTNNTGERYFAIPLFAIFGTFSVSPQFLPLRNMGVLSIELTLSTTRGVMNVVPKTAINALNASPLIQSVDYLSNANCIELAKGKADYSINNVYIYGDVVQPNPSIVEKCDQLVQSSTGISLIFSTWSASSFNVNYTNNLQLQVSRSYSHVRDLVAVFRPTDTVSSVFARGDQTYLGSRMRSYRTTIGSSSFPAVEIDNVAVALLETIKSFGHSTGTSSCVFNLQNYTGHTGVAHTSSAFTGLLENLNVIRTQGAPALLQASASHTASPSNFCICQSYSRLLGEGQVHALSGISTRLSGSILTLNLQLNDYNNKAPNTDGGSSLNGNSVDCIIGTSPLNCVIGIHSEQLLRIADSSIMVSD
jgi:hypothetical protein